MIIVKVKGIEEVIKKLQEGSVKMSRELSVAIKQSAFLVQTKSKEVTPDITGYLRNSINIATQRMSATITPRASYSAPVHARKPFMTWGTQKAESGIQKAFEDAVNRALK